MRDSNALENAEVLPALGADRGLVFGSARSPEESGREAVFVSEQVRLAASRLSEFLAGSEDVFVETGSRLSSLEARARAAMSGSAQAAASDAGASAHVDAEQLRADVARLERYLGASREGARATLASLTDVLGGAGAIRSAANEFENGARTLRVLAINTRIENARDGVQAAGLESVATDVRRLADLVEERFRSVLAQVETLSRTAGAARAQAEQFIGRQRRSSTTILSELEDALRSLHSLSTAQSELSGTALKSSEQVVRSIGAVLVSMQAHDATRQVLEHVLVQLAQHDPRRDDPAERRSPAGGELRETCELAAAQVRGARTRLDDALAAIEEQLRNIASLVSELASRAATVAKDGRGGSLLAQVEQGVAHAAQALGEHVEHERATAEATASVASAVEGIETHVRGVRDVGGAVKLVALNALVETERAGDGGRVSAVLARGMGAVAAELAKHASGLSGKLQEIAAAGARLRQRDPAARDEGGAGIATEMRALFERLRAGHEKLRAGVVAVHEESDALRASVETISRRIGGARAAAESLADIEQDLARLGAELERVQMASTPDGLAAHRGSALQRYTMASEREIHAQVVGEGPREDDPARARPGGHGLGDNVELF